MTIYRTTLTIYPLAWPQRFHRVPYWIHAARKAQRHDVVQDLRLHHHDPRSCLYSGHEAR